MKQSKRDMLLELVRLGIIEVRDDGTIWKMKRISQSRPDGTDAIPQEPRRLGWSTADGYEPFVATDPDYPADVLAVYPKAREHGVVLWGPSESGKYEWRTADDAHCWTRSKSLWEENGWPKEGYHPTRDLALKHAPTSPPPGYVESKSYPSEPFSAAEAKAVLQEFGPKPDPKPSLIEACAEAVYNRMDHGPGAKPKWHPGGNSFKQDEARDMATAAITRFLEEPMSEDDYTRCRGVFQIKEAIEERSQAMSIKLTKDQARKASCAYWSIGGELVDSFSAVANALVAMGVLVEPTAPSTGPTIEQRLAALEAKANRPASEPFVATDPDYPADVLKACPKAKEWRVTLHQGSQGKNPWDWRTKDRYWDGLAWSERLRGDDEWGTYRTRGVALSDPPTSPPPSYVESKSYPSEPFSAAEAKAVLQEFVTEPDPKPTPSLIEACAEAACNGYYGPLGWGATNCQPAWHRVATAAITRFLEEPVSYEEIDQTCDAYLFAKENEGGVTINLGRMAIALIASRRVLLERVKGGV